MKRKPFAGHGFTLLELMIVLVVIASISAGLARRYMIQQSNEMSKAMADHISIVGEALKSNIANTTAALGAAPTATTSLTVADLKSGTACGGAPCLTQSFVEGTSWTTGYDILVTRIGSSPFQYEGVICTKTPTSIGGKLRLDLVGGAVKKLGVNGGMTYDATGVQGYKGSWSRPSTAISFANTAGKLCYLVAQSLVALDQLYLRVDGQNQMLANLRMNNNAIKDATTIDATGNITSGSVVQGATITSAGNVNVGANGFVQSTGKLNIQAQGDLTLQPSVPGRTVVGGAGGSGNLLVNNDLNVGRDAVVENDVNITSLTSRPSAPNVTSLKSLAPTLVEINSFVVTAHGQSIPVPSCPPSGQPRVFVIPQTDRGQVLAGNWGSDIRAGGPAGGPWTLIALDNQNQPMPNPTAPTVNALARTFCSF